MFPNEAQRRDWWSNNYETWTPTDEPEKTEYLAELKREAENGPSDEAASAHEVGRRR